MLTKVKLKIVQNWRKIPVGGIVALNFGPIRKRRVGVGAVSAEVFIIGERNFSRSRRFHGEEERKERIEVDSQATKSLSLSFNLFLSTNPHPLLPSIYQRTTDKIDWRCSSLIEFDIFLSFPFVTQHTIFTTPPPINRAPFSLIKALNSHVRRFPSRAPIVRFPRELATFNDLKVVKGFGMMKNKARKARQRTDGPNFCSFTERKL